MKVLALNDPEKKWKHGHIAGKSFVATHRGRLETEIVQIGDQDQGCRGCLKCAEKKNRRCVFDNGILNGVLEEMLAADAMILGTPCYFTDMSAEMKALVDRAGFVAFVNGGLFQGKIGAPWWPRARAGQRTRTTASTTCSSCRA